MNYNPQVSYRGDQWIMQGGQQMAQVAQQLVGYFLNRGNEANQLRAQAETMIGPDGSVGTPSPTSGAPAGSEGDAGAPGGFNPVTPSTGGEDQGPSPAAQRGTQAEALRKVIQSYAPGQKDLHTALKAMSVDQLEGMLKGYAMKQAAAEQSAKLEDYAAQAALRRQNALDDQTVGRLLKAYGTYQPGELDDSGNPVEAPGERLRYALSQVPEAGGRALPKAVDALTRYEQLLNPKNGAEGPLTPSYTEDPVTGARTLTYGKQALPTGYNPAKMKPTFENVHDENGNLIGTTLTDVRGHTTWQSLPKGAKLPPLTDDQGNPIPGWYMAPNGKPFNPERGKNAADALKDYLEEQKAGTNATPAKATAPAAPPKVTTQVQYDALAKGTVFIGKDGKKYRKP